MDIRALAFIAVLLLLPAPSILLATGPATAEEPADLPLQPMAEGAGDPVTVVSVEYPNSLDPFNYSDVLVLINNNSAMSKQVGEYFAQARDIPDEHVAYLDVPAREVITKDQFEDLKDQVKQYMLDNGLVSAVNYIVTTKGFPLKIWNQSLMYEACVDEELALIFGSRESRIGNYYYVANPYAGNRTYFSKSEQGMYLVNRLTGYDWDDVKGLIDRANDTYGNRGLFVLDVDPYRDSSSGYRIGNTWLRNARDILVDRGEDVLFDETRTYIKAQTDVMGYCSWGSNDASVNGPGAKPGNTWVNGSIAETYVSTGGRTFTYPPYYGQSMIADWIEENVTGIKGYVYEPFLSAIAHPDVLFERYTAGFNLAESYRMSSAMLGWMGVVVGDPKSSPYRDIPDLFIDDTMVLPSNATPATGDPITIRMQVKNLGGRVDNATFSIYLNGETWLADNLTFDTFSLTTVDIRLTAPLTVGTHDVLVWLNDGPDPFFETLYDNNKAETDFTTQERPVISLVASATDVLTLASVKFTIQVDNAPHPIDRYYFEFHDGSHRSILQSNSMYHSFDQDGVYNVTAWVLDTNNVLSYKAQLQVIVRNRAPTAIIDVDPAEALSGDPFTFLATASSDNDGEVVAATWDLGDGNTSDEFQVEHAYERPGEYVVKLTVWDDDGAKASATRRVTVVNRAPVATFSLGTEEIWKGRPVTFDAMASSDADGWVISYEWDFGDGSSGEVTHSPLVHHVFEKAGEVTVTLTVVDDMGGYGINSTIVTVLNKLPVIDLEVDRTELLTGESVYLDGSGSYDDDGEIVGFGFSVIDPDGETAVLAAGMSETVTYKPADDGTHTITLTVTDDDGGFTQTSVDLIVRNRAPTIWFDVFTELLEDTVVEAPDTLILKVGTQDMDGEVENVTWYSGEVGYLLAEGHEAVVSVSAETEVVIIVIATDDDGASAQIRLNFTVNEPPVALFDVTQDGLPVDTVETHPQEMMTFDASNSSDPGEVVRYQWDFGDGFTQEGVSAIHGYEAPGTYTVTLKATDGHGATSETSMQVTVHDEPVVDDPVVSGTTVLIIVVLVIAVVAIVAYIMYQRGRVDEEEGLGD